METLSSIPEVERLGVAWVLRQAAVLAVLLLTAVHLAGVVCLADAERQLRHAARASAEEAGLPAATGQSVRSRAMRTLEHGGFDARLVSLAVDCNGRNAMGIARFQPGDEIRVTISMPVRTSLGTAVGRLVPWLACEEVSSEATIVIP
jgi:hypothetical protein